MKRFHTRPRVVGILLSLALGATTLVSGGLNGLPIGLADAAGTCGLSQPAFCDTFDAPAGIGNRSGELNGTVWGVSRTIGADTNFGQGQFDAWTPTQLQTCSGSQTVLPDNDVIVCSGQVREAVNDDQTVTDLAMYPKQPFDFAGRTGKVTFDVSNDTQGGHEAWPEFWITDQPVPTPHTHEASWLAVPRNGLGIRFSGFANAQGQLAACPEGSPASVGVDSAITVSNYAENDTLNGGSLVVHGLDCVKAATAPGQMNHYEIDVSQAQLDVYGTDAGTSLPLKHLASIPVNLSFTRGLIWLQDVHYNGNKFGTQREHTFSWDNVGFDGPLLPRDLAFDVSDALAPVSGHAGQVNLGWLAPVGAGPQLSVPNVSGLDTASAALLTFNFFQNDPIGSLSYVVNGHAHSVPNPFPDAALGTWRTLGVPVPLSDVVSGTNTVSISADHTVAVANVDLIMVGAGERVATVSDQVAPESESPPAPSPSAG
jgi:hypothetical protein